MPALIYPGDLLWCEAAASSLVMGHGVAPISGPQIYPGIVWAAIAWTGGRGTSPLEDLVTGSIVPGASAFTIRMPHTTQLAARFRMNPSAKAELEGFLAGAVLHELVHFRQTRPTATLIPSSPTARDYIFYYLNSHEVEAHGAQIAYELRLNPLPIGVDQIFETKVGRRIDGRIHCLSWSTSMGASYAELRHVLAAEVNRCIALLV